jgi:hypothetical protein
MKKNNLDNNIKEKLAHREITPSVSAWERLSVKLDEKPKQKKKGLFWYASYAASVLALISFGIYTFSNDSLENLPKKEILVNQEIDTVQILNNIEEVFNEVIVEKALVETETVKKIKNRDKKIIGITKTKVIPTKEKSIQNIIIKNKEKTSVIEVVKNNLIIDPTEEEFKNKTFIKPNSRIKINAQDLLFAVINEPKEAGKVAVEIKMNRADLLAAIKTELNKSNLKVDPETILVAVERSINDDFFQNNFLKSLKDRVTNIATAVAIRNN